MRTGGDAESLDHCRSFAGDWREWRRLRAWQLKQRGWSQRTIAAAFGVSEGAVSRWTAAARQDGSAVLLACPSPGAPRRLTDED